MLMLQLSNASSTPEGAEEEEEDTWCQVSISFDSWLPPMLAVLLERLAPLLLRLWMRLLGGVGGVLGGSTCPAGEAPRPASTGAVGAAASWPHVTGFEAVVVAVRGDAAGLLLVQADLQGLHAAARP